ncbi:hypothetical protein FKW77_003470 [Venturia effusa]|uniref:Nucleoporin Nup54 alpha-helical domain-containing protein n=1 Tax=Venturia effusa TaxID=50376 RepID=A0A517LMJ2_9PEZI|nr:hypothetical protein FKW77_003470 [Venturia effusa]
MSNFFGAQQKPAGGGLFGSTTQQPAQQTGGGGLFGSSTQQTTGGLFGSSTQQPAQQQTSSLFGAKPSGGLSMFGSAGQSQQQPQQSTGGLFGGSLQTPQQQQQPPQSNSLFASLGPAPQSNQSSLAQSFLAGSQATPLPRLGQSQWQAPQGPRERQIPDQMLDLIKKWHPDSAECVFQHYFYTNVGPERAPFFQPSPSEDPRKWEEALKNKPSDGAIPVLARGFGENGIGGRMKVAEMAVHALYQRVNEINESLRQRIEDHDLKFTVRTMEARRKHIALSRRTLALATKVQVLRNRGYALDGAEEELKTKLSKLQQTVQDPVLSGRQEELWARMTIVRERAGMLKEETEKLGKLAGGGQDVELLDEETMGRVKKILSDYDSQLGHLRKEVDMIKKDFEEWEAMTKQPSGR